MVDVRTVRTERRAAFRQAADDDPERVDDRNAEHEQGDGHLRGSEDGQDRQREAHELDSAGACEDRRRVEIPAQEAKERTGEGEAEDRDEGLADQVRLVRQADETERDGGDEGHARRQTV